MVLVTRVATSNGSITVESNVTDLFGVVY